MAQAEIQMTDLYTKTTNALVDALKANRALFDANGIPTGIMQGGTEYWFQGGLLVRLDFEISRCPMIALHPQGEFEIPHPRFDEPPPNLPFALEIATKPNDVRDGLLLLRTVAKTLRDRENLDLFGIPEISELKFGRGPMGIRDARKKETDVPIPFFYASCPLDVIFRQGIDVLADVAV